MEPVQEIEGQEEEEEEEVPCPGLLLGLPSSAGALVWAALDDERASREDLLRKTSKHVSQVWAKHIISTKVLVPPDIDVRAGFEKMPNTALTRICGAQLSMRTLHLRRKLYTLQLATPKCPSGEGRPTCQETVQTMLRQLAALAPAATADGADGAVVVDGDGAPKEEQAEEEEQEEEAALGQQQQQQQNGVESAEGGERQRDSPGTAQQEQEEEGAVLHSVTTLHLTGFHFWGPDVPTCTSRLCLNLTSLELSHADVSGAFFTPLARLPSLRALTLLHATLVDLDATASLTALTALTSFTLDRVLLPAACSTPDKPSRPPPLPAPPPAGPLPATTAAATASPFAQAAQASPFAQAAQASPFAQAAVAATVPARAAPVAQPPAHLLVPGVASMHKLEHLALHLHPRSPHPLDIAQLTEQLSHLSHLTSLKAWGLSPQRELDGPTAVLLGASCPVLARLSLDRNVCVSGVRELLALRALTSLCARSLEPAPDAEGQSSLVGHSCSWQHLSLGVFCPSLTALSSLPLHSLSAPFHLGELDLGGHPAAAQGDMESVAQAVRHALANCVHHCSTLTFTAGKLELCGASAWGAPPLVDAWPALLALDLLEEHWQKREQQQQQQQQQQQGAKGGDGGEQGGAVGSFREGGGGWGLERGAPGPMLGQAVSHIKLVGLRVGQQEVAALATALGQRVTALTCTTCTITAGGLHHMFAMLPRLTRLGFGRKCTSAGGLSSLVHALGSGLQGAARRAQLAETGRLVVCLTRPVGGRVATESDLVATEAEIHECRQKLVEWALDELVEMVLGSIS